MRNDMVCIVHSIIMQLIIVKTDCLARHQSKVLRFTKLA